MWGWSSVWSTLSVLFSGLRDIIKRLLRCFLSECLGTETQCYFLHRESYLYKTCGWHTILETIHDHCVSKIFRLGTYQLISPVSTFICVLPWLLSRCLHSGLLPLVPLKIPSLPRLELIASWSYSINPFLLTCTVCLQRSSYTFWRFEMCLVV